MKLLLLMIAAACARPAATPPPVAAPAPTGGACPLKDAAPHLLQAQDAVIRQDLDVLRRELEWLDGRTQDLSLPAELQLPRGEDRLQVAGEPESEQAIGAAAWLGRFATTCGECHQLSKAGPSPTEAAALQPNDAGIVPHMQRHRWALDRMWEGLVTPSNALWASGVRALVDHPIDASTLAVREDQPAVPANLDAWVHRTGAEALLTDDPRQRGQIYGELLATCAECHAAAAGAPDPQH